MTMTNNTHAASGAANNCTILPDGSAFAVASFPLPKDHWLYAPREYDVDAENPKELPSPILTHALRAEVVSAIRYAIRGATMCGKETDFDPDALVQNAVYALCGPYGSAALAAPAQAATAKQSPHPEYDKGFSDGWNRCEERQAAAPAQAGEREAFEAWVAASGRAHMLKRDDQNDWYADLTVTAWWTAWQASAARGVAAGRARLEGKP